MHGVHANCPVCELKEPAGHKTGAGVANSQNAPDGHAFAARVGSAADCGGQNRPAGQPLTETILEKAMASSSQK